jgi:hypothetical protein
MSDKGNSFSGINVGKIQGPVSFGGTASMTGNIYDHSTNYAVENAEDVLKMMATLRELSKSMVAQVPEPQREQAKQEAEKIETAITEIEAEAKKAPDESQLTTAEWLEQRVKNLVAPVTAISLMVVPATEAIEAASENVLNASTNVIEVVANGQSFAQELRQITGSSAEAVEISEDARLVTATVEQYIGEVSKMPQWLAAPSQ